LSSSPCCCCCCCHSHCKFTSYFKYKDRLSLHVLYRLHKML
jgi:hypothetical protein